MKPNRPSAACLEILEGHIAPALTHPFVLDSLAATDGFRATGVGANDLAGIDVSSAGDLNGDGIDDLLIGAHNADEGGTDRGAAYVVFGKSGGFGAALDLASLDGTNGFKVSGLADFDRIAVAVSGAGDINGDAFDDILIGAPSIGVVYVIFGKASGFGAAFDLSSLDGTNGFKITSITGEGFGENISAAGDVNGDGFDDVILGAAQASEGGTLRGASYVVFGKAGGFASSLDVASLDGANGFKLSGASDYDQVGSVGAAGDVNGDGFDDVIIGADFVLTPPPGGGRGAAYVVFGKSSGFPAAMSLSTLDGSNGFKLGSVNDSERAGHSVSGAGDVNGDGFDDVIIGAPNAGAGSEGAAYVVFGRSSFAAAVSLSALDGSNGFKLTGAGSFDASGGSVSGAGDVNGDGFDDVIVGAGFANDNDAGASYVVFGKSSGFPPMLSLAALDGITGVTITTTSANANSGQSVSRAGDINGDGAVDLIIGAPGYVTDSAARGAAFVLYGGGDGDGGGTLPVTLSKNGRWAAFTDADGDLVTVTTNKGAFTQANFRVIAAGVLGGGQFQLLSLAGNAAFAGATINIKAKPGPLGGDGFVNIGAINAVGLDLGAVTIKGDLGQIDAGDSLSPKPALKRLAVQSLGRLGLTTQSAASASLTSDIIGDVKVFTVKTDVDKAHIIVAGNLGVLSVGGRIIGGSGPNSGLVEISGAAKRVNVRGSLIGGAGIFSGSIFMGGTVGSATIGGSLDGGIGGESGVFESQAGIGRLLIKGSINGSAGFSSGSVICLGTLKNLRVNGSVIGGEGKQSGSIFLDGADDLGSANVLRIDGSLIGGTHPLTGIFAGGTLGKVTIGMDVRGTGGQTAKILAEGPAAPADAKAARAIGSLTIGGVVENADILAGYDTEGAASHADVQIGRVMVRGSWAASNLVCGVLDATSDGFGRNDTPIMGGGAEIVAQIASVIIKGAITGSAAEGDHFGISAERVLKLKTGAVQHPLDATANNILLDLVNNDFRIVDFA